MTTATLLLNRRSLRWRSSSGTSRPTYICLHTERNTCSHNNNSTAQTTPITIIGGGPSGLLLSNLLSLYQVPSILLEGQSVDQRCSHPQAHFLNTRTMEILRHQLPLVYTHVREQMTPVEQWKHFQFGYNMLPSAQLARVQHPLDRPLRANLDANGILVVHDNDDDNSNNNDNNSTSQERDLSPCTVGHLAQHTFCRILYEAATQQALNLNKDNEDTQLLYNTCVTKIEEPNNTNKSGQGFLIHTQTTPLIDTTTTTTSNEQTSIVQSKVCIAADGAHSFCRKNCWEIEQVGQVGIQHLVNIHVKTCPEWAREYLHDNNQNFAMLYSVFHPNIVAMIVCHSVGEYVFQVPFFPPYQSLHDDYSSRNDDRVEQMVLDAMGVSAGDNNYQHHRKRSKLEIVSVKPWTMSSLLADKYYHDSDAGVGYLVGDAAHVFPPAGGLGMNTGLQDVFALAWKLAWAYHNGHLSTMKSTSTTTESTSDLDASHKVLQLIGNSYHNERRPVAQANAALSVRNYNRLLEITKACYLSEQHPTMLIQALEASSTLVPFPARRDVFHRLFATATWTLSSLRDLQHPYTRHLRNNIRRILARGGGLPLLFPQAELGFGYHQNQQTWDSRKEEEDTMGFSPSVRVGHLFPHLRTTVKFPDTRPLQHFPNLKFLHDTTSNEVSVSLSDLPAQISRDSKPCFVLLVIAEEPLKEDSHFVGAAKNISTKLGITVELVEMLPLHNSDHDFTRVNNNHLTLQEEPHGEGEYFLEDYRPSAWLIRPDGHIAGGLSGQDTSDKMGTQKKLLQNAQEALFGSEVVPMK